MCRAAVMLALASCAVCAAAPPRAAADERRRARALLLDAKGAPAGAATFVHGPDGVTIHARVRGLPPGTYAIHLHAVGRCDAPDFRSAGPSLDPAGQRPGATRPDPSAGDLRNVAVDEEGKGVAHALVEGATLADGPASLLGTALVVHARAGEKPVDASGTASDRIACGVVGGDRAAAPRQPDVGSPPSRVATEPVRSAPDVVRPGERPGAASRRTPRR